MVKKPYKIANNRQTKRVPKSKQILDDHNAKKISEFKRRNKRLSRRRTNHDMSTLAEAINDGRYQVYERANDTYKRENIKPVRGLYNSSSNHLFSIGDSWPTRESDGMG
jgi:hypothetical protein